MSIKFKQVSAAMAAVVAVGALAGCGSGEAEKPAANAAAEAKVPDELNTSGFPIVKQSVTLKALASKNALHGEWKDMQVLEEYEKKTGIKIEWNTVPQEGYVEKRNLDITGGNLPDLFYRSYFTPYEEVNYGTQGVLIPLNGLIEKYAPNIKALFEKHPEIKKGISAPDGNIYTLPQVSDYLAPRIGIKPWINKKWLDEVGLPVPETTDDYYKALKAFKDHDLNHNGKNDEIPWSGDNSNNVFSLWLALRGAWGLGTTGARVDNFDLDPSGKVRFYPVDGRYKELLEYIAKLYQEGLIDKDTFTQKTADFIAKGSQGIVGSVHVSNTNILGNKYMNDYVSLPALKGPHGDQLYSQVNPAIQQQGTFAITSANKHPEATIRWVDYFYSEEGSKFFRMGLEGVTFDTQSDGSVKYKDIITNNPKGLSMDQAIGQYTPWPGGGLPQLLVEKYDKTGNSLPSALASAKLLEPNIPKVLWPNFLFKKEEQDRLNALATDINAYVNESRVKFITGALPFSEWDNYVAKLKKMGSDELTEIYKTAYERYNK